MKILIDVKDYKAAFFMEVLGSFSFVKPEILTPASAQFFQELKQSAKEVSLAKQGKIKLKSAEQLLDGL